MSRGNSRYILPTVEVVVRCGKKHPIKPHEIEDVVECVGSHPLTGEGQNYLHVMLSNGRAIDIVETTKTQLIREAIRATDQKISWLNKRLVESQERVKPGVGKHAIG